LLGAGLLKEPREDDPGRDLAALSERLLPASSQECPQGVGQRRGHDDASRLARFRGVGTDLLVNGEPLALEIDGGPLQSEGFTEPEAGHGHEQERRERLGLLDLGRCQERVALVPGHGFDRFARPGAGRLAGCLCATLAEDPESGTRHDDLIVEGETQDGREPTSRSRCPAPKTARKPWDRALHGTGMDHLIH
jgi:hypothetical protein